MDKLEDRRQKLKAFTQKIKSFFAANNIKADEVLVAGAYVTVITYKQHADKIEDIMSRIGYATISNRYGIGIACNKKRQRMAFKMGS